MENTRVDLSVIIPLYNAQHTLDACLKSVCNQKEILLEIILINDGSSDATHEMCLRYAENDSRIKFITRQNGGVAAARNSGLEIASGKYITFADQDDWIEPDAYTVLVKEADNENADMVVFGYSKDMDGSVSLMQNRRHIPKIISEKEDLIRYAFFREEYRAFAAFVWNKIFKREFLEKYDITFDGTLRRGDDVLFFAEVAAYGPKTVYVDKNYYHYVQRADSVVHTLTKENIGRLGEILVGYDRAIKLLSEKEVSENVLSFMKCFYAFHASTLYELSRNYNLDEQCEYYRKQMLRYRAEYNHQNKDYPDRIQRMDRLCDGV